MDYINKGLDPKNPNRLSKWKTLPLTHDLPPPHTYICFHSDAVPNAPRHTRAGWLVFCNASLLKSLCINTGRGRKMESLDRSTMHNELNTIGGNNI